MQDSKWEKIIAFTLIAILVFGALWIWLKPESVKSVVMERLVSEKDIPPELIKKNDIEIEDTTRENNLFSEPYSNYHVYSSHLDFEVLEAFFHEEEVRNVVEKLKDKKLPIDPNFSISSKYNPFIRYFIVSGSMPPIYNNVILSAPNK